MSCGGGELWDEVIKAKYGGWQRRLGDNGPSYKQSFWWRDLAKICWNNSSVGWFNSNVEWKENVEDGWRWKMEDLGQYSVAWAYGAIQKPTQTKDNSFYK
ncbi:hypothetical protein GmHk_12G035783 [Glycine max]|nr:hypothetical protein GmHk_12G035783 [Glycine max]